MQRRWLKLIWYFWPGLLSLLLTLWALVWFFNPQPSSNIHIATEGKGNITRVLLSPDGRYLALHHYPLDPRARMVYTTLMGGASNSPNPIAKLYLIDLAARREIFSAVHDTGPFGFDPRGNLLWNYSSRAAPKLFRWSPETHQQTVVFERSYPYDFVSGIAPFVERLGKGQAYYLLSPDCQTWLIPRYQGGIVTYELVDVPTRKVRARLALPEFNVKSPFTARLEAEFSNDSKWLVVQTNDLQDADARYWLRWFDVETGQQVHSLLLPVREPSEPQSEVYSDNRVRLNRLVYFTKDYFVAEVSLGRLNSFVEKPGLALIKPSENKISLIELEELKPVPDRWQIENNKQGRLSNFDWECHSDEDSKSLITSCQYPLNAPGNYGNLQRCLPFQNISVRSRGDGKLQNSFRLYFSDQDQDGYSNSTNALLAYLPDQKVFMKRHIHHPGGKIGEWIEKAREWLRMDHRPNWSNMIYLLDTKTGKYDCSFSLKQDIEQALLLPNQTQLLLCRSDDAGVWIDSYDYPLHKPWLLILSWSFGIAIGMTLLVEARRWWMRRGWAKSNRHLQHA